MLVNSGFTGPNPHFQLAAVAIGWAFVLDGLDGRIARLTKTVSEFGREMDSLADVITFGLAPALLAWTWGASLGIGSAEIAFRDHLRRIAYFLPFLFLLCGAARLARFNIQKNPVPKNPGRPDRKYFVGLPIPAAAALVAAVVYALDGVPLRSWQAGVAWLGLLGLLAFLMISTWRYRSFKDIQLLRPRSSLMVVVVGSLIYLLWHFPQPFLLAMATAYVASGIVVRIGGTFRRRLRHAQVRPEHEIG
jgi:CDP-diacylglycerol--serine O-phosphatidyltransferase